MIITQTPFRVSFAGGGSDLESYYLREPGAVLSTAINKYMYITVKERFGNSFRISYSKTEVVDEPNDVEHPIVRECLRALEVSQGLEIVSIADLPAKSGMGSSSSFTVGLLHALYARQGRAVSPGCLARQACEIEIERLQEPIGKQDQYIAAYGGLQFIQFRPDKQVFVNPVVCSAQTRRDLSDRLLLFYTGVTRNARDVLSKQRANTADRLPALRRLCEIAYQMRDVLTSGADLRLFGACLHNAWETKKSLEASICNPLIDGLYERGLKAGALGGKLLGAGSGGFILFYCEPEQQAQLRAAMEELIEVPFAMESQGTRVVFVGEDHF